MSGGRAGREGGAGKEVYRLCPIHCALLCFLWRTIQTAPGRVVTLAHELGHNSWMNHDTLERGCSCKTAADKGGCIMNPSTGQVLSCCSCSQSQAVAGDAHQETAGQRAPWFSGQSTRGSFQKVHEPKLLGEKHPDCRHRACGLSSSAEKWWARIWLLFRDGK